MNPNHIAEVPTKADKTCALPRAGSRSSTGNKAANAGARHRGVEVIMANHGCGRSAPTWPMRGAASPTDEVPCNQWELFALLGFIALSFVGLFFGLYRILAECRVTSPF